MPISPELLRRRLIEAGLSRYEPDPAAALQQVAAEQQRTPPAA